MRRAAGLLRAEVALLGRDPAPYVATILMPIVVIAFVAPAYKIISRGEGYESASGAEHAVPAMAVMFLFFVVATLGFAFFREFYWGTWPRLVVAGVTPLEAGVVKSLPFVVLALVQQAVLLGAGAALFDLHIAGSALGLVPVAIALCICLVGFALLVIAVARTQQQLNSIQALTTMVFGGLGGALTPTSILPGWAKAIAPGTPTYWAIDGYRCVILDGGGPDDVLRSYRGSSTHGGDLRRRRSSSVPSTASHERLPLAPL